MKRKKKRRAIWVILDPLIDAFYRWVLRRPRNQHLLKRIFKRISKLPR